MLCQLLLSLFAVVDLLFRCGLVLLKISENIQKIVGFDKQTVNKA